MKLIDIELMDHLIEYHVGFSADNYTQVGLYINTGTYQFVTNSDQNLYVNKVNGKLEVTFCSIVFNNPFDLSYPITISARIIEP